MADGVEHQQLPRAAARKGGVVANLHQPEAAAALQRQLHGRGLTGDAQEAQAQQTGL
jgi:kynureninase